MLRALRTFQAWLRGQAWFPGRDSRYNHQQFLSSGSLDLGPSESPPQKGFVKKLRFHSRMLWRRALAEAKADWPRLKPRLWVIIPCLIFQYIHAIFTGMAYYMHTPLPEPNTTLHDLGFEVLPYLSVDAASEILVYLGFVQFFLWLLSPFATRRKTFSASVVAKRVLVVLVSCQILRIISFLSTQLPAPAPHCRGPEPTSDVPWPVWWRVIIVDVARQASKGCGDLIFSSHITFLLAFTWCYCYMGSYLAFKAWAFLYTAATGLCIIASRKHYTVDITVAFYVVPLVAFHFFRTWTYQRDDICTADNRGLVSLLPPTQPPTQQAGSGGGANGSVDSSRKPTKSLEERQEVVAAAGLHDGEVTVDVEMAARSGSVRLSSGINNGSSHAGGILDKSGSSGGGGGRGSQPGSPMKEAWGALTDLPRRISSRTAAQHRRTESQEPVLAQEDQSASSL